ncbi:MAG: NADP-dependent oxidoreductase [Janthinobacterium lividum]
MKAIQIHQFGGVEELKYEEAPMPNINPDDVLVKIYATSVNPVDWKVREGAMKQIPFKFPLILGWDFSGVIKEVGSEVKDFKVGQEVYGKPDITRNGTYAEYVAVKANEIAAKPTSVSHTEAASIPLAGLTAWQGIFDHGKTAAGQKILIHGASGGVGTIAVQLAKWKGAYVIATSSEKNIAFLKELGADKVIDYQQQQFEKELKDLDFVFDTIGGDTQKKSVEVLKPGGILITTVAVEDEQPFKAKNIQIMRFMAQSDVEQLKQMADLIDSGKLKPVIDQVFPLQEIVKAQELSAKGHTRGKIAIKVTD